MPLHAVYGSGPRVPSFSASERREYYSIAFVGEPDSRKDIEFIVKWLRFLWASDRAATAASAFMLVYALYTCLQLALQDDVRRLLPHIVDDASYYMTIARNLASGAGVTFDGIHNTNGFHPLWLLMLVPLFLLDKPPEMMIRLVALLQIMLLSLAYVVFLRAQLRLFSPRAAALSAVLFVPLVFMSSINGMETAVLILGLVVLYSYGASIYPSGFDCRGAALLGVIVGFVVLARIDMLVLPLVLTAFGARYGLVGETRRRVVSMLAVFGLTTSAVVAPYLVFSYRDFGTIIPISASLKSTFPHLALSADTVPRIASMGIVNLLFAALAMARALWSIGGTTRDERTASGRFYSAATTVFAWTIALLFLLNVLFLKTGTFGWYYVPYRLFGVVVLTGVLDRGMRSTALVQKPFRYAVVVTILCIGVVVRDQAQDKFPRDGDWHTPAYDAAVWVREHTPLDAVFAMSDCGHFAFFSMRRVINLDGLVNNMDLQRALARHQLGRYLRENQVEFLVQHAIHDRKDVIEGRYVSLELPFPSWRFGGLGDSIRVTKRSEVYRSAPFVDGPYPSVLVIWSLTGN